MIAQHRKKECCTSEEGKLKNKIMFAEIFFFFLPLCKPAKLCFQSFKTFFHTFAHQFSDHHLQGFKPGKQTNTVGEHWQIWKSEKFFVQHHKKKMLQSWRRKSQKQHNVCRDIFIFFTFCKLANLIFRSCKTFFCKILSFRTLSFNLSELYFQFWIMAG